LAGCENQLKCPVFKWQIAIEDAIGIGIGAKKVGYANDAAKVKKLCSETPTPEEEENDAVT
jgi:hypothetical protein